MKISDFMNLEYTQSAVYQNFRSIGNYIDSFKPSSRKVAYTVDKYNIRENIKVAQLQSKVAECTQYLHGEQSLYGVIVGMATNFNCSNTVNLLEPNGMFGSRFIPGGSAAGRYIYTHKAPVFDKILRKEDAPILTKQYFENSEIEYQYYVPIVPLILVNGNYGIGNGFAQCICQRDLEDVKNAIKEYLKTGTLNQIDPKFKGFTGVVERDLPTNTLVIKGTFKVIDSWHIEITELPYGYDLKGYLNELDSLIDRKIIKDYEDKCEEDRFNFIITCAYEFSHQIDTKILNDLRLIYKITENFTCIDEDNKVIVFKNEMDLLDRYIKVRLDYYNRRKAYQLKTLEEELVVIKNRIKFIDEVIKGTIVINNKTKLEIENQLVVYLKVDNSYDYLLKMPLWSLSKDKIQELNDEKTKKTNEYNALKNKDIKAIWGEELNEI